MDVLWWILAGLASLAVVAAAAFVVREVGRSGWAVFRTRLGRSARLWRLALRRVARFLRVRRRGRREPERLDTFHVETAEQVFELMGGMKGAVMKLGQMVSVLGDSLPEHYSEALRGLQQSAPPMAHDLAARVVEEDLGAPPDEVFDDFTVEPVAAASIGQVHRARLRDGRDVAVKIQYPGVDVAIRADLDNMFLLTNVARMMAPGVDPEGLVGELKAVMLDELDYHREAANQRAFARAYVGHPWVRIPQVFPEVSGRRVLTTEWVSGRTFYDVLHGSQEERDRVGEQLFRFWVGSVGRLRFFNADPHPGNYFFADDGTVWFLDFGMARRFTPDVLRNLTEQVRALRSGSREELREAMVRHGWFGPDADLDMERVRELALLSQRALVGPDPYRFTTEASREVVEAAMSIQGPYGDVVRNLTLPPDHVMLNRIQLGVGALLGRLRATGPWAGIFDEYFLGGEPLTPLGREAAGWPLGEDAEHEVSA